MHDEQDNQPAALSPQTIITPDTQPIAAASSYATEHSHHPHETSLQHSSAPETYGTPASNTVHQRDM